MMKILLGLPAAEFLIQSPRLFWLPAFVVCGGMVASHYVHRQTFRQLFLSGIKRNTSLLIASLSDIFSPALRSIQTSKFGLQKRTGTFTLFSATAFSTLSLSLALTLPACSVQKNYQQPTLELPQAFTSTPSPDTSIATMDWKQFFTDPSLQNLIENALKGNFNLRLAAKRINEAEAYLRQSRMNTRPAVQVGLSATTTIPSENSLGGISLKSFLGTNHVEDYSLNTSISWEADIWGKMRSQREAALADYMQTNEAARAVQTTLIANVANSYFNLLMLDAQIDITRRNLALSDTIILMMRLQKGAGLVTELAVQLAVVQRQKTAIILPQLEEQITIEENSIRILSGQLPAPVDHSVRLNSVGGWNDLPAGLPAKMISRRPDVRAAELALIGAHANLGIARANMYPSLNITAAGGLNAFKASKWFVVPTSLFATAAGSVVQPVLQRRQLKTQLEVAQIQKDAAEISFRSSALNAIGEVVNVLVRLDKLAVQKQIATEQVDTLQKAINNAQLLFRSGLADYLEVIATQTNSLQAELSLADIKRNQLNATVELYRALGGGLK